MLARLETARARRARQNNGLIRVLDALRPEGEPLDPNSDDDREAADLYWTTRVQPDVATADPKTQRARTVAFARGTGVVPDAIRRQRRAQLHSSDAAQVVDTAALAVALDRAGLLPDDLLTAEQRIIAAKTTDLVEGGLQPAHAVSVAQTEAEAATAAAGFSFGAYGMAETSKSKTPKPKARSAQRAGTGRDCAPAVHAAGALSPLDYLLQVMRDGAETPSRRMEAAKAAAPFVHPRRATVEHAGGVTVSHEDALDALD